jgi:hypothetical protein
LRTPIATRHAPWCSSRSSSHRIWYSGRAGGPTSRRGRRPRKARKILEAAWAINPHPDLAESYADLRLGDSARERLARMQKLAGKVPGQLEGALAVARAALDAREFATARAALASHLSTPHVVLRR